MAPIRFGPFALDVERRILLYGGSQEVSLRQQCWDLLVHLARHLDRPLSREELTALLWPDTFVASNTLHYLLWDLRRTLAQFDRGNYIVKMPRRGYRLATDDVAPPPPVAPPVDVIAAAAPAREEAAPLPLLLDREADVARLHDLFGRITEGRRQIAFVSGEPGIGKSLLVESWMREVTGRCTLARANCLPGMGSDEPYAPLLEIIERLATRDEVIQTIRRHAPTWLVQLPGLLPAGEMQDLRQSLTGVGPARMVREGVRLFEALASSAPLVVVIEDLRWVDRGTLAIIEALASRSDPAALMLLGTLRSVDVAPQHGSARALVNRLVRAGTVTRLNLQPLTRSAISAYVDQRFDQPKQRAAITALLEGVSGGNPLFLTALADYLVVAGIVRNAGGGWLLDEEIDVLERELPESLRGMIGDQLELLPGDDIATLEAASVAGSEFAVAELAAALQQPALEIDTHCARMAADGRFLVVAARQSWPDGTVSSGYRFRHLLYQRAVYGRVAPENRRLMHDRIGTRLAAAYGEHALDIATRLTEHFEAADNLVELARYQEAAAATAFTRFSPAAALAHCGRAIATIRRLPPSRQRDQREAERQLDYANLAIASEGYSSDRTRQAFDRALELARQSDLPILQFRAQLGISFQRMMSGAMAEAEAVVQMLIDCARANPPLASAAWLYSAMVHVVDVPRAFEDCVRAHAALGCDDVWRPPVVDLAASIAACESVLLSIAGQPSDALAAAERACASARATRAPVVIASILTFCACGAVLAGDALRARRYAEEAFACADENDIRTYTEVARMALDWAIYAATGRGLTRFERAVARRARSADRWYQGLFEIYLAEALCREGELERAQQWIDAAIQIGEPVVAAELWRVQGEIHRRAGVVGAEATAECFRKARAIARRQGTITFEQRAAEGLAACKQAPRPVNRPLRSRTARQ